MSSQNQIIERMSKDLNISKYIEENPIMYRSRVIYSALSAWVKISTLDHDILDNKEESIGQSRKYLCNSAKIFLDNMFNIFPEVYSWFYPLDLKCSPESLVINRLRDSGEIVRSGFNTNLALPNYEECAINNKAKVIRGMKSNMIQMHIGLTQLRLLSNDYNMDKQETLFDFYGLENKTALSIWHKYINNTEWRKRQNISCHIFDKYSKVNFYRSWKDEYQLKECEISIYKENLSDFGVIKKMNGEIYTSQFSSELVDDYEIRRFMYALKCEAKNNVIADYKYLDNKNLVELNLKSALPIHENNIFLALGWPKNSIQDSQNLIFSVYIWDFIKLILENLNITIREID